MKIHEYQGKEILRAFGGAVPRGKPALSVDEAVQVARELGGGVWVGKAQIHACGRVSQRVTLMASSEGGTEIEEVAEKTPELIHKIIIDPIQGLTDADADAL